MTTNREGWRGRQERMNPREVQLAGPVGAPQAAEVRAIRERLGLTQAQLAARLGVVGNTVARWERGEVGVSEPAIRLARTLSHSKKSGKMS